MGTQAIAVRALLAVPGMATPRRVIELGAGDGKVMLGIARQMARAWPSVQLTLLDRLDLVSARTRRTFEKFGWQVAVVNEDVMQWAGVGVGLGAGAVAGDCASAAAAHSRCDIVFCNLFLHHFEQEQLISLFNALAHKTHVFFACEPRRARLPLLGSHLVGLIGSNAVTRADAVLSVRAGFRDQELSRLWPQTADWQIREYSAGLFSHCFLACRK